EDGQLLTFGSDGVIRGWDYELISGADCDTDSGRFEMEPLNEMVIGHNICISSMVKSSLSDSFVWFAQDSNGKIWKLDLSFSNKALDPVCLFSFHHGPIQGLDVSKTSYLMATIALDYSVKVFDFLEKRELKTFSFKKNIQKGKTLPYMVGFHGCLLLIGFEDGVVRVFELYNPQRLHVLSEHSPKDDAGLRLKQAFKPHNAAVTAVAYERNGEILATGSVDCTVFFFTVEEKFNPIGFVHVPGAVQALEWSPQSHVSLILSCYPPITFHLSELPRRSFRFTSIKSRIKEEIIKHRVLKEEKKKEKEERLKESQQTDAEQEEEEEEELSPLYIPDSPSPLYCGLYSRPGQFWLSMVQTQTLFFSPLTFPPSSIESAKQNLQKDCLRREAERKLQEKQKKLAGLQKKYEQVLKVNQSLPEHVHLIPEVQKHVLKLLILLCIKKSIT
uniref:Uncharacterized protein n=1 Tax=Acanthochromis polyacanthus TaxID=80966 RepID=A0A3Q1FFI5_9TELE